MPLDLRWKKRKACMRKSTTSKTMTLVVGKGQVFEQCAAEAYKISGGS